VDRAESLGAVPVKNVEVTELRLENGHVQLSYPVVLRPWFSAIASRFGVRAGAPEEKKLQLDALGTAVWDMIDGRRTVRRLAGMFADTYRLHPREAEVSVTRFLYELGKRGVIGFR